MKRLNIYFILFAITFSSFAGYSNELVKTIQAHKPPILTTTVIIEIYEGGQFKESY